MSERLNVLAISSHPDDETIFMGGALAKYAQEGANVHLVVVSNGEKGRMTITNREQGVIGSRQVENDERQVFAERRQQECLRAAEILGIQSVDFLGFPDLGINESALLPIKNQILKTNPHIVLTFNEAGTTTQPDHSWTGISTFYAIKSILENKTINTEELNFASLMMFTLPDANRLLIKHGELITDPVNRIGLDIQDVVDLKIKAAACYETQVHLMNFFLQQGILTGLTEQYIQRISRNGQEVLIDTMPKNQENYVGSSPDLFELIQSRCSVAQELINSFQSVLV